MSSLTDNEDGSPTSRRWRSIILAACLALVAVAIIGLVLTRQTDNDDATAPAPRPGEPGSISLGAGDPVLLFQNTALGDDYGHVSMVAASEPAGQRTVADLECERVHYRDGNGICLHADRGADTTYEALIIDNTLAVTNRIPLAGAPSRARVSPGGELAAATVFVTGHAYEDNGFSTDTILIELATGRVTASLETEFTVLRDGETWREEDFNFWGVTFVDANEFYATLGTGGLSYLVSGDIAGREMVLMEEGIECPSLSPDGRRLAYKRPVVTEAGARFQLEVIDLGTRDVTVLAETRSVDDQVAWLDDDTVIYGVPDPDSPAETDAWAVPGDGTGTPEVLVAGAWSTAPAP